jgi:DNA invertase Pin-like site-specific DNA recombinase
MKNDKLTPETIQRVKELLLLKHSERDVASGTGVSQTTVWKIKHGWYDTGKPVNPKAKSDIYDYSFY